MKLTYWYAECQNDNDCYSVRARTKREAEQEAAKGAFGPVVKVVVEYADGFELLSRALGEGGIGEEGSASLEKATAFAHR